MTWQPIETAPRVELKDVILFDGHNVYAGQFWEGYWVDSLQDYADPQPTHWHPLPPPPCD